VLLGESEEIGRRLRFEVLELDFPHGESVLGVLSGRRSRRRGCD